MRPTLKLFTPINRGRKFIKDITQDALGWRRSMRAMGGYWIGSFTLESKGHLYQDVMDLVDCFYKWLGAEIVEESGGFMTWQGLVYSMDLTHKGLTRRRSLDLMSNYVRVEYLDDEGEAQTTVDAENSESIDYYGRREALITYDGIGSTAATAFRDRYLNENGHPYARVVGIDPARDIGMLERPDTVLNVSCCGYIFTGNWRFERVGDGTVDNLSDWMTQIVQTDMEFVDVGYIAPNTIQVYKVTGSPKRAWDVVSGLTGLGDTSGNPYSFMVGNNRLAYYSQIATTPQYYLRNGKVYGAPSGDTLADIWRMRPAVIRDMDYPAAQVLSGGWLTDIRDFYAYELDCSVDGGLIIKTELFDESELLIALASFLQRNEREGEKD